MSSIVLATHVTTFAVTETKLCISVGNLST